MKPLSQPNPEYIISLQINSYGDWEYNVYQTRVPRYKGKRPFSKWYEELDGGIIENGEGDVAFYSAVKEIKEIHELNDGKVHVIFTD